MAKALPNDQYSEAIAGGLAERIIVHQRRRMYERFLAESGVERAGTILDVGVSTDRSFAFSNYLEQWYPYKSAITAVGIEDAAFLQEVYPGMQFVRASGLALPFKEKAFDIVHSSAVLEHVGSIERQTILVRECCRVAATAVFVTTPNRWFPIEVHTGLPLVHWLPKPAFRAAMRALGRDAFAEEANLNLLTARELRTLAAGIESFYFRLKSVSLAGWPSNLLLVGHRRD